MIMRSFVQLAGALLLAALPYAAQAQSSSSSLAAAAALLGSLPDCAVSL